MLTIDVLRSIGKGVIHTYNRVEISFEDLKKRVVEKIKEVSMQKSLEAEDFSKIALTTITDYVHTRKPYVENYVIDNKLLSQTLIADLYNSITSWGKLTIFKENDKMRELQLNGPVIFVDTDNGYDLLRDPKSGEVIKFDTPKEALDFVKSTLVFSGQRMTEDEPLVNTISIEGFRISVAHPCVFPGYVTEPTLQWVTGTYRKVGGGIFSSEDLVRNNTACMAQLKFIELTYQALLGMAIVGTTGCGKTTIQDLGMRSVKNKDRVICIQAPSEYHYRNYVDGIMTNNAVYWEVDTQADPTSTRSATQNNLVTHSLRNTASLLMIGEGRNGEDFISIARAINAGTRVTTTFHTFDIPGTIDRFALELVTQLGIDMEMARELACKYLTNVTLCDRLGDGSRKVMGNAEIQGYDRMSKSYLVNYLFEFVLVDSIERADYAETGLVYNVGYFVKRNDPSKRMQRDMVKSGVNRKYLQDILDIPCGSVLNEVNFDKLPQDYVVEYDYNVIPKQNSSRASRILSEKDSVGIAI